MRASLRRRLALFFAVAVAGAVVFFAATAVVVWTVEEKGDSEETMEALERILASMAIAFPVTVGGAAFLGATLARKALAPMREATERVTAARASELDLSLPVRGTGDEWDQLAATLNALLADARRSIQQIRRFTSDAAHELRTPLTVIMGEADVSLRRNRTPSEYKKALQEIGSESRRLSDLIDRLLTLARGDAEALSRERRPVLLTACVQNAIARLRQTAKTAHKTIQAKSSATTGNVMGDPLLLERAFENLIENAIHHGGKRIAVTVRQETSQAVIEVADNGPGIPTELAPQIFDRFVRGDESRTGSGFGLGLSITKATVEAHGGTIELANAEPGARFVVRLPTITSEFLSRTPSPKAASSRASSV